MAPRKIHASLLVCIHVLLVTYVTRVNAQTGEQHVFSDILNERSPHYNSNLVCKGDHKRTICYYPNSTTTFNLSNLSCGDVEANPGPQNSDEARDIQKSANKLKYDMNQLIDIGKSSKVTISSQIKNTRDQ